MTAARRRGTAVGLVGVIAMLALVQAALAADALPGECHDDAILVVDASGSMATSDPSGYVSRIHRVRQAMAEVVPPIAATRNLGLMVYGGGAVNGCSAIALKVAPGPNNAGPILSAMRDVLPNGQTPLTESVSRAAEALDFRTRPATIVLLTEGEENCGGDPCRLADRLRREGLRTRVHVIDYKHRALSTQWRGTLQSRCLAETTGGRHLAVDTTKELIRALRDTLGCVLVTGRFKRSAAARSDASATARPWMQADQASALDASRETAMWTSSARVPTPSFCRMLEQALITVR